MTFVDTDQPSQWDVFCARVRYHKELGLGPAGQVCPPPQFWSSSKHDLAVNNSKSEEAKIYRRLKREANAAKRRHVPHKRKRVYST